MGSSNGPQVSSSKRKLSESYGEVPTSKVARASTEHEPLVCSCAHSCHCHHMRPKLADSCFNYLNSKLPHRILFYNCGKWKDFSIPVVETLAKGFEEEKSSIVFSMNGQALLFDFLWMLLINLRTRKQRSVAWIDKDGKSFFPTFIFDDEAEESSDLISGIAGGSTQGIETGRSSGSPPEVVKRVVVESGGSLPRQLSAPLDVLRKKIEKLENNSADFLFVQNMFLSGMGPFASPQNIIQIHQVVQKDNGAKMRQKIFEKQINMTREERCDANVQYAWYGSKKTDIIAILIHGFGMAGKPTEEATYGTGIYLAPKTRAFGSVSLCDNDEKEIQYMLLCRVVLGKPEQIQPGSKQCLPSSEEFDTGVDNLSEPKCFVIWPTHTNSYIHPEYLVSFKLMPKVREYLSGLKDVPFHESLAKVAQTFSACRPVRHEPVEAPISPWVSFTTLFEAIQDRVSPVAIELLCRHNEELKCKLISREEFVQKIRLIVGDQLLVSTLKKLQHSDLKGILQFFHLEFKAVVPIRDPLLELDIKHVTCLETKTHLSGCFILAVSVSVRPSLWPLDAQPALWYCSSKPQKAKPADCASPIETKGTAAQKMEPNDSPPMRANGSTIPPAFDLNNTAAPANELNESAAAPTEHSDISKTVSGSPSDNSAASS